MRFGRKSLSRSQRSLSRSDGLIASSAVAPRARRTAIGSAARAAVERLETRQFLSASITPVMNFLTLGVDSMQAGFLTGSFGQSGSSTTQTTTSRQIKPAIKPAATIQPAATSAPTAISINFEGGASGGAPLSLAPTDTAGVVQEPNWNNAPGNMGATTNIDSPTTGAIVDSTGAAVTGASITWNANNTWGVSQTGSTAGTLGDQEMMTGYLDLNQGAGTTTSVTVSGIPYPNYDVYAYVGSDGNGRTGHGTLGSQAEYFITSDNPFNGYVQATGTNVATAANANYLLFQNVEGSSFTYKQNGDTSNVGLHGIEIVSHPLAIPASPTLNPAVSNDKAVVLSWNSVQDATSYDVYRSDPSNTTPMKIASGLTNTTYTDNSVVNSTTYTYYVTADNYAGVSPPSNTVQATPEPVAPVAPTNVTTQNGTSGVNVYWQPSQFATYYTVQRATDNASGTYSVITPMGGVTGTSFTDTTAKPGHTYYYEVAAGNAGGLSPYTTPGVAGQVIAGGFGPSSINVNFTGGGNGGAAPTPLAPTDVAGIVPSSNYDNEAGGSQTAVPLTDSGTGDTGATLTYTAGGDYSAVNSTVTPAGGDEKLNDGFVYGDSDVQVNNVPYSHFDLYVYELNDGAGRQETTTLVTPTGPTGASTYYGSSPTPTSPGLIDGNPATPYVYTQATDTTAAYTPNANYVAYPELSPATAGNVTNGVEFTTTAAPSNGYLNGFQIVNDPWQGDPLAAPVLNTPIAGPNQVKLSWMPSANAFNYTIYRAAGNGTPTAIATNYGGTSYTDMGLTNGTAYTYTVVANNTVSKDSSGNPLPMPVSQSSPASNAQTATPEPIAPLAPTGVTTQGTPSSVNVSWQPSLFATSYSVQRASENPNGPYTVITPMGGVTGTSFSDTSAQPGHIYYYEVSAANSGGASPYTTPGVKGQLSGIGTGTGPAAISVNFTGGRTGGPAALSPNDIAGFVPAANYNNENGGTQTAVTLADNANGASGATLTYKGGGNYAVRGTLPTAFGSPDEALNDGFVYGTTDVQVNNIPYSHFDVYAYELNDAAGRLETTTLETPAGPTTGATSYYGLAAPPLDSGHVDLNPATPYVYTQSTDTTAAGTPNGDYVEFPALSPQTATYTDPNNAQVMITNGVAFTTSAPGNGYVNGFQIVDDPWQGDPLPAPVLNTPTSMNGQVQLTWTPSQNAFYYTVYRQSGTGMATPVATAVEGTSYTDSGLTTGTAYTYYVVANNTASFDNMGNALTPPVAQTSPNSNSVTVTPITTLPTLTGTTIGDGTTQRSEVRSITLSFNEPVTLGTGAVTLSLLNSGGSGLNDGSAPTDASSALGTPTTTDGGMTWTIPFLVSTTYTDKTGSLTNGIYTVTVHASKVSSGGLTMASDSSTTFHRLFGDIDGNKTVNNLDYLKFKKSYGTSTGAANYNANFDYDNNGTINNADYLQFKKDYGKTFTY